nr:MAG TPA_asm: helix-turn-helix domain protein [Caudoviricetes sp.]
MVQFDYISYFGYCQFCFEYFISYFEYTEVCLLNSVGERLAYTRSTILSMNQKDFSKLLGVSQGALSEIENNKRGLPMEAIIELMKYSKTDNSISCSWILTGISDDASESALSSDEKELISTYNKLDRRGQHRVHTIIYEELDRMDKTPEASASRSIS